jgi:hypothetical protein
MSIRYPYQAQQYILMDSGAFLSSELAASVPRTEIVGKSDYFRFGMRDSLAIEAYFLQVIFVEYLVVK